MATFFDPGSGPWTRGLRRGGKTLALLLILLPVPTIAYEQLATPFRIGVLTTGWGPPAGLAGLVEGLVDLGYEENDDFVVGVRFTQGDSAALPAVAQAMIENGVDVLVPVGPLAAEAAQDATSTHPIVFISVGNPIGRGLIESYARPGGNVTGVADYNLEASGKRLQLFKELVPAMRRILFAYHDANPYNEDQAEEYRRAAERLNVMFIERKLSTVEEARAIMSSLRALGIDGIIAPQDVDLNVPGFIVELAARQNIPSMFDISYYVGIGGLASYGSSSDGEGRQAARLIDKIIKGSKPVELPVETAHHLEFVINLRVARELGIVVSPETLVQADRVAW